MDQKVLDFLKDGTLSSGHAKAILSISDEGRQAEAAELIVSENLNVRKAEAACRKLQKEPKQAMKKTPPRPSIAAEVEISLREVLGTEVKVLYKEGQGSLNVGFYSDEQLRAFAKLLGEYK